MLARAHIKYIRMSVRKVRYVIAPLRHRTVAQALAILSTTNRRAVGPITKAIASAFANAKQADPALGEDQVVISRLVADGGPAWKRFRAAAFGRAAGFRKRTTHLLVELDRPNGHAAAPKAPPALPQRAAKPRGTQQALAAAAAGGPRKKGR